jgi:hypothetical protein
MLDEKLFDGESTVRGILWKLLKFNKEKEECVLLRPADDEDPMSSEKDSDSDEPVSVLLEAPTQML